MASLSYIVAFLFSLVFVGAQSSGNGTYTNPVLNTVGADPYVADIICRCAKQTNSIIISDGLSATMVTIVRALKQPQTQNDTIDTHK